MNIAVVTNLDKAHGGEAQGLAKLGLPMYNFNDCHKIKADLVIVLSGGQEQEAMIKYLPKLRSKIAWWMCDFREPKHFDARLNSICDVMFVPYLNYHKGFERLTKKGVRYLPQSGNSWKDYPVEVEGIDAIFIGNVNHNKYHSNRLDILGAINNECKLIVISDGGTTKEQTSLYSKIPLSIAISSDEIIGGCSNRLYNILKAGGCALVKHFEGIENMFENHKHLIWFKDTNELNELIKYYISNPDKIAEIKRNALWIANAHHNIESRIKTIIQEVNAN